MRFRTRPSSLGALGAAAAVVVAAVLGAAPATATTEPPPSTTRAAQRAATTSDAAAEKRLDAAAAVPKDLTTRTTKSGRVLALPLVDESYALTSAWGARCIPVKGASTFHYGLDMATGDKKPIYAVASGVVTHVVPPKNGAAGYLTVKSVIEGVPTWIAYVHPWDPGKYVKVGDKVKVGNRIAEVGASGPATGPHLHLEVWKNAFYGSGTSVDPKKWLTDFTLPVVDRATADRTQPAPTRCYYYSTTKLNLRAAPSTSNTILTTLKPNTKMLNTPGVKRNGFIPVTVALDGKRLRGWVHTDYISQVKTYHLKVDATVRANPNAQAKALFVGKKGTPVSLKEASGGWRKVVIKGTTGWVPRTSIGSGLG